MAALRVTQFFRGVVVGNGGTSAYTVPAGYRIVLRSAIFKNESGAAAGGSLWLSGASRIMFQNLAAAGSPGDTVEWRPWLVIGAGQTITVTISPVGAHVDVVLGGSLYFI